MIAIHNSLSGFHPRWVKYCEEKKIPYKLIDCYANDVIHQLKGCNSLMWHHSHIKSKDLLSAKPILLALQHAGIRVFPDFNTNWHFDNKLAQKYLFEALELPNVPTYIFLEENTALSWIKSTSFPKVFKLKSGAGSTNVKIVNNYKEAKKIIKVAFNKGFSNYNKFGILTERIRKWRLGKTTLLVVLKGFFRLFAPPSYAKVVGHECGYVYFQDFIPNNEFDIRVIVIGNKAFAIKRLVRINDFRASGSGNILYEKHHFNQRDIKLAFEIHKKLQSQCTAMDFVYQCDIPLLVEISYGFSPEGYDSCPGYWDSNLDWHEGDFDPYGWMVEEVLKMHD